MVTNAFFVSVPNDTGAVEYICSDPTPPEIDELIVHDKPAPELIVIPVGMLTPEMYCPMAIVPLVTDETVKVEPEIDPINDA